MVNLGKLPKKLFTIPPFSVIIDSDTRLRGKLGSIDVVQHPAKEQEV